LYGGFYREKPLLSLIHPLCQELISSFDAINEKSPARLCKAFFSDKRFEISNLVLLRDLAEVVDVIAMLNPSNS